MYPIQEQFKSDALAQLNSGMVQAQQIAGNLLEISHEIGVLNVRTSKASAEAMVSAMHKMLAAGSPMELFELAARVMRPDVQVWAGYAEQLRSIAGKMTAPAPSKAAPSSVSLAAEAEQPSPDLQGVVPPAALATPAEEPPVLAEPLSDLSSDSSMTDAGKAEAQPQAASRQAESPDANADAQVAPADQAVQEVTEAINSVAKAAPVISAASAPDAKQLAKTAVVPKAAVAKLARKQGVQRSSMPAKPAGRGRKG